MDGCYPRDRKSTRLNSSHLGISDAGFFLQKIDVLLRPRVQTPLCTASSHFHTLAAARRWAREAVLPTPSKALIAPLSPLPFSFISKYGPARGIPFSPPRHLLAS